MEMADGRFRPLFLAGILAFVVVCLAVAKEILIPVAVAMLLTFVLAPVVRMLERRLPHVVAVALTVVLAVLVMLALLLPVIMAIWFAPPLVAFHGRGAIEAMQESFLGCLKNIVPFLVYGVVFMVLGILASIPLGLGWLVLGPVLAASAYTSYKDIFTAA